MDRCIHNEFLNRYFCYNVSTCFVTRGHVIQMIGEINNKNNRVQYNDIYFNNKLNTQCIVFAFTWSTPLNSSVFRSLLHLFNATALLIGPRTTSASSRVLHPRLSFLGLRYFRPCTRTGKRLGNTRVPPSLSDRGPVRAESSSTYSFWRWIRRCLRT